MYRTHPQIAEQLNLLHSLLEKQSMSAGGSALAQESPTTLKNGGR